LNLSQSEDSDREIESMVQKIDNQNQGGLGGLKNNKSESRGDGMESEAEWVSLALYLWKPLEKPSFSVEEECTDGSTN